MRVVANPFDPNKERVEVTYDADDHHETQRKIQRHLPIRLQNICKIMAKEAALFKIPAAQIMTDIFHQSMQKWPTFVESTTLSDLRRNHINLFDSLQAYQSRFTSSIYAPLHEYLSTTNIKFEGNANDLLLRISEIFNRIKKRRVMENCGIQFDVRYIPNIASIQSIEEHHESKEKYDSEGDDEEADEVQYTFNLEAFHKSTSNSIISDISKYANITTSDTTIINLDKVIKRILDEECNDFTRFHYPRHEILMDDTNVIKTFPAIKNNTIPAIDIENIPFCRIYNSTNSVQSILDYLSATKHQEISHMMTFSIHYYYGQIEIYFHIYANGKLYGSRMFEDDLMTIIPKLFEDEEIEDTVDIFHNFKMENHVLNVQFNHPKKYEECKFMLYKRNRYENESEYELNYALKGQLERFIFLWNSRNDDLQRVDINEIIHIFMKYEIDDEHFEDGNNRQQFTKILQHRDITPNFAEELWMEFEGETAKQRRINQNLCEALQQKDVIIKQQEIKIYQKNQTIKNLKSQLQRLKAAISAACTSNKTTAVSSTASEEGETWKTTDGDTKPKEQSANSGYSRDADIVSLKYISFKPNIKGIETEKRLRAQTQENQRKIQIIEQKDSVIMQQKLEIEDLRQQIQELQINMNHSPSHLLDTVSLNAAVYSNDMILDVLKRFCDTDGDNDSYDELDLLSDRLLDSDDINNVWDRECKSEYDMT